MKGCILNCHSDRRQRTADILNRYNCFRVLPFWVCRGCISAALWPSEYRQNRGHHFAGVSTESAVRLLKNFEKEGLIELNEKDIRIIQPENLSEISKRG
ncbi:MAG: helix-turn-helix domain-containing protein [Bacteroidetes bacterium]|nr:helix-turn-helix domain-containing protein [Bacteroidota bacterium]MCL6103185.1 helix-turn-helix domain-containing protein [Bacteroidota bacterium]